MVVLNIVVLFVLFVVIELISLEIEVYVDILLALQFGEDGIELLREELAQFSPQNPEIVCTIFSARSKEMAVTYPIVCEACMIRGQCTAFDKQVLNAKGRCNYHQGADYEMLFKPVPRLPYPT